ncbi:type II secretion system ATPase GspE [Thermithiobacillus plumbiphilus]|uniref:Type II secretion system protein E n=1 Tax=Thermithiobacillus plumbiphilus TaxID=1729899 RepID=A0ABU9DB22_9PROT
MTELNTSARAVPLESERVAVRIGAGEAGPVENGQPNTPDSHWAQKLPYHFARNKGVVVAGEHDGLLEVWARAYPAPAVMAELRRTLGRPLSVRILDVAAFDTALNQAYERRDNAAERLIDDMGDNLNLEQLAQEIPEISDLLEAEDDAPIIRLINALLTQAMRENASDIHIEAFEERSVVRFRVDGALRDIVSPQRALHAAMVSRIKVMAQLDIAEKRLPQDGRIGLKLAGRPVDVRVSTLPTGHGERVVLRLLDKQAGRLDLDRLGMPAPTLRALDSLIRQPHGIILVTGPTGSGKTTTLYAALSRLDTESLNIMTVEDPIEYDLSGVGQTQVNPRIDLSFARALRAILRQDPDVVMIGEIRDLETAQIAVQASLTGHLVLATLHTNDAVGAVTRLADMGVEPFLLASSLIGVLAQRLVRKLCPICKEAYQADERERAVVGHPLPAGLIYRAKGCPACGQTGYQGRSGIYELITMDDTLRRLVHDEASEQDLRDHARKQGMLSLREDGMRYVAEGATSIEEVLRVARS